MKCVDEVMIRDQCDRTTAMMFQARRLAARFFLSAIAFRSVGYADRARHRGSLM
jgi:hypothetical protein